MATEILFAKTFLSLLDGRPPKISPDHIEDPRTYPGHSPYTLPRHPSQKPFSKPPPTTTDPSNPSNPANTSGTSTSSTTTRHNPGAAPATSVTLRSARNPPFELTLPAVSLTTSLAEVKERVAAETGIPLDKIKLLAGKKPVGDSKVLKDLLSSSAAAAAEGGGGGGLELGVMVLGGGAAHFKGVGGKKTDGAGGGAGEVGGETEATAAAAAAPVAQGLSGEGVLKTEVFWEDLKGYLQQRVRDEGVAGDALGVFKSAWEGRS